MAEPIGRAIFSTTDGRRWFDVQFANARLADLGADLNDQFVSLFARYFRGDTFDEAAFRTAAFAYFDGEYAAGRSPDQFFDNLGILGLPRAETPIGWTSIWEWALTIVHDWEKASGKRVHKGTGYYFAGVRDIALGDIDRGFLYMHQAAKEDAISSGNPLPQTPAVWFVTLDSTSENQAYHEKVAQYEALLEEQLADYRAAGRGALTRAEVRARLVRHPELLDGLLAMAHVIARLSRLGEHGTARIRESDFAEFLLSQIALELCLVLEDVLRRSSKQHTTFAPLAAWYAPKAGMTLSGQDLKDLNGLFNADFDSRLAEVLDGRPVVGFSGTLSPPESDLAAAYGIRNQSAHGLERPAAAAMEFERLIPRIFWALFLAIETLFT